MSVVGGIRNAGRCSFATNISRSDDRFRRAATDLYMWHAVGVVESRNIRRPKDPGNSWSISLLAFGGYSYRRVDMPSGYAVSGYSGYS